MIETLENLDRLLFLWLNGMHTPFLDKLMWVVSQLYCSLPLIVIFYAHLFKRKGKKYTLYAFFGLALVVLLSDRISVELFKEVFMRYRPTHNLDIQNLVHTVTDFSGNEYRGGLYGFISSHATNFFGMAMYFFLLIRPTKRVVSVLIFGWAILVSYSRIYLGVHYPSDVMGGAILGLIIGLVCYLLFNSLIHRKMSQTK